MNFHLDSATISEMTEKARQCFLEGDAPEYLQVFEKNLHLTPKTKVDFKALLRAAHSLKGGAALAQFPGIQALAHKIEDLLLAIQEGQIPQPESAWLLFERGIAEVAFLLTRVRTSPQAVAAPDLLDALQEFQEFLPSEEIDELEPISLDSSEFNPLIAKLLKQDLEASFVAVEAITADTPDEKIIDSLSSFFEECWVLGETLDLPWLVESVATLEILLEESSPKNTLSATKQAIERLRKQRERYLKPYSTPATSELSSDLPSVVESGDEAESSFEQQLANSQLRVPLKRLERMTDNVEESILSQERLRLQQQLLGQANKRSRQLELQLETLRQQLQAFGEGLDSADSSIPTAGSHDLADFLSGLQSFQELIWQVRENRADLDLIERELSEELDEVDKNLKILYNDVTKSRLVPFRSLAQRFVPQIQYLNRRYDKSVSLEIEGDDLLLDQLLLEQLQIPLTHLLNNAFDHGIEPGKERLAKNKPETAKILLKANTENNQLVIVLVDDGRGINLNKIYRRAIERRLCDPKKTFEQFSKDEIIDFIFQPNFSTAEKVSEISGRGVGLDIVRNQIQMLRGTIRVDTEPDRGTKFTLKLPLSLSLLSLLLFQWQNRILAVPTTSVRQTLLYGELDWVDKHSSTIRWQQKTIAIVSLSVLLAYSTEVFHSVKPTVAIVLEGHSDTFAIAVDTLISERESIVKPFDDTVPIPPYLAGCTILGNGDVVPVILPQELEIPSIQQPSSDSLDRALAVAIDRPTIMIVEDSVATRRLLEKLFVQMGFKVVVCRDGQEALDEIYLHSRLVDLVITDIEMPRVNGLELLQTLQSDPFWKKIPIVVTTFQTGERHRQQAMKLGANAYITKPFQPQDLLAVIQPLLNKEF